VSFLAAIAAVTIVSWISIQLLDGYLPGLLAAGFLWIHPVFVRHSYAYMPDTLSIALTAGAVAATLKYTRTRERRWFGFLLVLLTLGITNHMWEATVLLPIVVILGLQKAWKEVVGATLTTVLTAGLTWSITELQSKGASTLTSGQYPIHENPGLLLSADWWLRPLSSHPFIIASALTVPLAVLLVVGWIFYYLRSRDHRALILAAWLSSGLVIPVLLPGGYLIHESYYIWAILAPLAVSCAFLTYSLIDRLALLGNPRSAAIALSLALIVAASAYGLIFELGALAGTGVPVVSSIGGPAGPPPAVDSGEAVAAGYDIRQAGIVDPHNIVFQNEWKPRYADPTTSRVLIYSGVLIKERQVSSSSTLGPRFTTQPPDDCGVLVVREGKSIQAESCM
jgi:4-amino-4-deoxy-L-arabinose transferase-like glycosyltransferase